MLFLIQSEGAMDDLFNVCKFPTLTILIDDNYEFLDLFARHLMMMNFLNRPYQSWTCISEYHKYKTVSDFDELNPTLVEESFVETDLSNLHKIAYSRNRFDLLSSIVVDYDMPGTNGLRICKDLNIPYVQKSILSNVMCEEDVIDAFNRKEINSFIRKGEKAFFSNSYSVIRKMQNSFFSKITEGIEENVPILKSKEFRDLVMQSAQKANAIEMYLLDRNGSFLFIDENGKVSGIISHNQLNSSLIKEKAKLLNIRLSESEYFAYVNLDDSRIVSYTMDFYIRSIYSFTQIQAYDGIYNCLYTDDDSLFINLDKDKIFPFKKHKEELVHEVFPSGFFSF